MWKEPDPHSSRNRRRTESPTNVRALHGRPLRYTSMEQDITVKIEAPADMSLLRPLDILVRNLVEQLLQTSEDKVLDELELAFNEAYTNIFRHAYPSGEKGRFSLIISIRANVLELRFEDDGRGFDPDEVASPDFEKPGEGGLGVWIMRQVMDEYDYFRDETGRNVLRLIKRFPAKQ